MSVQFFKFIFSLYIPFVLFLSFVLNNDSFPAVCTVAFLSSMVLNMIFVGFVNLKEKMIA